MSLGVNEVFLAGNVGNVNKAQKYTRFGLCTNHRNEEGEDIPTWHNIVCAGKIKDWADERIAKGKGMFVRGRLTYRTNADGIQFCNIFANHMQFTQNRKDEEHLHEDSYNDDYTDDDVNF